MGSIEHIMDIVGKKWSLLVINEIARSKKIRYNQLQSQLDGISPSTLTSMLKQLEQIDIIERKTFSEIPPRVEYSLSKKGNEFEKLLEPLTVWAKKYDNIDCKCNSEKDLNPIQKIKKRGFEKLVEASMCACTCMAMMAAHSLISINIF